MTNWDLIAKHLAGETTQEEAKEFEQWLATDKSNEKLVESLKVAMRPKKSMEDFSNSMEEDWVLLQKKIGGKKKEEHKPKQIFLLSSYRIAAALLLLVVASFGIWYFTRNVTSVAQQFTSADSVRNILLPDGSRVWLNKFSKLEIAHLFGEKTRSVALTGEAYFEVAKDKSKPFLISSGKIITQVVGTTFNISQKKNGSVKIVVEEGKVLVKKNEIKKVFLLPGETAIYSEKDNRLVKERNTDLNFLTWKTGVIRFEAEPLKNVCDYLSRYYKTNIQIGEPSSERLTITTVIDNTDLQNALSIISLTLNLKIEKADQVYYLKKK